MIDLVNIETLIMVWVKFIGPGFSHGLKSASNFAGIKCLDMLLLTQLFDQLLDPVLHANQQRQELTYLRSKTSASLPLGALTVLLLSRID